MQPIARTQTASLGPGGITLITVEARFRPMDRCGQRVVVTGLPDGALREIRTRLPAALAAAGALMPQGELHLHLSPATQPKRGGLPELGLLLAAAVALGHVPQEALANTLAVGEVDLEGNLEATQGVLAGALAARRAGLVRCLAPPGNAPELRLVAGIQGAYPKSARQAILHLAYGSPLAEPSVAKDLGAGLPVEPSLDEVMGQAYGKRALLVCAAGGHSLLMRGSPGIGKSMLARRLPGLLPPLSNEEFLELLALADADPRRPRDTSRRRPFRAPHHTTSFAGLVGGGPTITPGEVSLAHRGVLFLDELPEFRRETLEALREPLELGEIRLARADAHVCHPAQFILVAAMNPCPCGWRGHERRACRCTGASLRRYEERISGPLLDRFDLLLDLAEASSPQGQSAPTQQEALALLARVREQRVARGQRTSNARIPPAQLSSLAQPTQEAQALLAAAARERQLSTRAQHAVLRLARTLADLEAKSQSSAEHLAEALHLHGPRLKDPYS